MRAPEVSAAAIVDVPVEQVADERRGIGGVAFLRAAARSAMRPSVTFDSAETTTTGGAAVACDSR